MVSPLTRPFREGVIAKWPQSQGAQIAWKTFRGSEPAVEGRTCCVAANFSSRAWLPASDFGGVFAR